MKNSRQRRRDVGLRRRVGAGQVPWAWGEFARIYGEGDDETAVHELVHLVWATWDRLPLITRDIEPRLYRCIAAEAHRLGAEIGAIGGIEDHVHVPARYPPSIPVSELVKQMKGVSSRLVHDQIAPGAFFKWQGSYGAFSIAHRDVPMVRRYVHRQEEHHRIGRLNATLERTEFDDPAPFVPPAHAAALRG
ncbi:MAG TPA: IS200/IS605 family transposase [Longimicrobium sp.]|nr:IS200/IS605 family transposase [Longimicrobium sp.]